MEMATRVLLVGAAIVWLQVWQAGATSDDIDIHCSDTDQYRIDYPDPLPDPSPFKDNRLRYFLHVEGAGSPRNQYLLPPLSPSTTGPFGQMRLFNHIATDAPANPTDFCASSAASSSSASVRHRVVGSVRGFVVDTSNSLQLSGRNNVIDRIQVAFLSYDDGRHKGTVQIQGERLASATDEIAVIGGTGSFRGVRGYGFISALSQQGNSSSSSLVLHDLYFL